MTRATVTELPRRLEALTRDTFIDDCSAEVGPSLPGRLLGGVVDGGAELASARGGGSRRPA